MTAILSGRVQTDISTKIMVYIYNMMDWMSEPFTPCFLDAITLAFHLATYKNKSDSVYLRI